MSADNMPPLPAPLNGSDKETPVFAAGQMHAYARAYAAEQTRELVEALELAESYIAPRVLYTHGPAETQLLPALRALIAKHKEQA